MALTLEEMAVHFSSTGDAAVVNSFNRVGAASNTARETVTRNFEQTAALSEKAMTKLEHVTIQASFVLAEFASRGEVSMTSLLHSIAALGFALPGHIGVITTAVASVSAALIEIFTSATKKIKEEREAFQAELGKLANAGEMAQLEEKFRTIMFGEPFDEKGQIRKKSEFAVGAFEGSLADLEAHFMKLNAALPRGATMASHAVADEYNKVVHALDEMREKARLAREAIDAVRSRPADIKTLPTVITAPSDAALEARRKKIEDEGDKAANALLKPLDDAFAKLVDDYHKGGKKFIEDAAKPEISKGAEAIGELAGMARKNLDELAKKNEKTMENLGAPMKAKKDALIAMLHSAGNDMGMALAEGFQAAFAGGGLTGGLSAFGNKILSVMGNLFIQMGLALIDFGAIMAKLQAFLMNIFTAGPAAIAAGVALIALGGTLTGIAMGHGGGGGGGGGGGYSPPMATSTSGYVTVAPYAPAPGAGATTQGMSAVAPVQVNATIIGKDDPKAQREIMELVGRAQQRGTA